MPPEAEMFGSVEVAVEVAKNDPPWIGSVVVDMYCPLEVDTKK